MYSVRVESTGFKSAVRDRIELFVGDRKTADFTLEVGAMQETLTVSAAPPMLEETTATRGSVIENLRVTELPINGRNPFILANLSPASRSPAIRSSHVRSITATTPASRLMAAFARATNS